MKKTHDWEFSVLGTKKKWSPQQFLKLLKLITSCCVFGKCWLKLLSQEVTGREGKTELMNLEILWTLSRPLLYIGFLPWFNSWFSRRIWFHMGRSKLNTWHVALVISPFSEPAYDTKFTCRLFVLMLMKNHKFWRLEMKPNLNWSYINFKSNNYQTNASHHEYHE